jgi:hypothetical protein
MTFKSSGFEVKMSNPDQTVQQPLHTYAILQETSGEESESWLYFIRYQGNEEALAHLQKQLSEVEWYILGDLSTFDLETDYLVSERTAKEMTKVDLNACSFHRKFDGKLQKIDLGFKDTHSNEKKMTKAFDVIGYGKLDEFIDGEDIDPEDLASGDGSETSESETESSDSDSEEEKRPGKLPSVAKKIPIPRYAAAKKKHK